MHTNKDYGRAMESREKWRIRAQDATSTARRFHQRADYHSRSHQRILRDLITSRKENEELRAALERAAQAPMRTLTNPTLHILCLCLVLRVHVSFRSVPKILAALAQQLGILIWAPHYTTLIEWALRLGLSRLRAAGRTLEPWIGIVDFSIQCGKERVLVVLRLPLRHMTTLGRAPTLADCETLAAEVRADWNAERITATLKDLTKRCGEPAYWLTDGASDLKAGLRSLPRSRNSHRKTYHLRDVGHVFANALRSIFEHRSGFADLMMAIQRCAAKVRQTEFAHLAPPRLRAKGRFQSIERITDWFRALEEHLARYGRDGKTPYQQRLEKFFGWTKECSSLAHELSSILDLSNNLQALLKVRGMSRAIWPQVATLLEALPPEHPFRVRIEPYLRRCLQVSNLMGGIPLVISDDVIESLFGVLKSFMGDGKIANFGRLALLIPTLTGTLTESTIEKALAGTNTARLRDYVKRKIPKTLLRERRSQLRLKNIRRRRTGRKLAKSA
jgi:hypothetical protein